MYSGIPPRFHQANSFPPPSLVGWQAISGHGVLRGGGGIVSGYGAVDMPSLPYLPAARLVYTLRAALPRRRSARILLPHYLAPLPYLAAPSSLLPILPYLYLLFLYTLCHMRSAHMPASRRIAHAVNAFARRAVAAALWDGAPADYLSPALPIGVFSLALCARMTRRG